MRTGPRLSGWFALGLLGILLASLSLRAAGVILDFSTALRYPFALEYGEGIVWQQAVLIPGPRMYGNSPDLPFIAFHYPPLYYLFTRAALPIQPNFLAAGRFVSSVSAVLIALSVAALVRVAGERPKRPIAGAEFAVAVCAGLLVLCLDPVRSWGMWMRVDTAAIALGMVGLLAGAWANGRFWGTTVALLLCVASVFTKQTELPFGIAVFLIALLRNPRGALCAAAIAGSFGVGALGLMETLTGGGFLHNIIGYNINRFDLKYAIEPLWSERWSFPFMALTLIAAGVTLCGLYRRRPAVSGPPTIRQRLLCLRGADRATTARAMLLLHFALASLMLFTLFKSGSSTNYLLAWFCVGGALIGVLLWDLAGREWLFSLAATLLILAIVMTVPIREMPDRFSQEDLDRQAALVRRIAGAEKPVASEDMTLLMLAGKQVTYEPAIVTELAAVGRWNEGPLVNLIRSGGFAFMITGNNTPGSTPRRSSGVDAAMRQAYPRVEQVGPLWLHLPLSAATSTN